MDDSQQEDNTGCWILDDSQQVDNTGCWILDNSQQVDNTILDSGYVTFADNWMIAAG